MSTTTEADNTVTLQGLTVAEIESLLDGLNRRETAHCDVLQRFPGPALGEALANQMKADRALADRLMRLRKALRDAEDASIPF